ncbi:MAG: hypothetical protein Q4G13_09170 [Moraxella sp.]|nr:hypothetical protein [Moraxella sp.]
MSTEKNSIIDELLNIDNSPVLKKFELGMEVGNKLMDKADEKFQIKKLDLESLIETLSKVIDEKVIDISRENNYIPLGGEIQLSTPQNQSVIQVAWDFYFNDQHQKIQKTSSKKEMAYEYITDETIKYIAENSPKFNINAPELPEEARTHD